MQENHFVTVNTTQQPLPVSRIDQTKFYLKAGAVLLATTAVYLAARVTRLLPQWQSGDSSDVAVIEMENTQETVLTEPTHMRISLVEEKEEVLQETSLNSLSDRTVQSVSEHRLTDFQEIQLALPEQEDVHKKEIDHIAEPRTHKRKLLQTAAPVVVANPIPDQIIQIGEAYSYDLSQAFSGDYIVAGAVETNAKKLPSWLNLEYQHFTVPQLLESTNGGVLVSGNTLFMATTLGVNIFDISSAEKPTLIRSWNCSEINWGANNIAISGNVLFTTCSGAIQLLDVSNLTSPKLLWNNPLLNAKQIIISENIMYIVLGYAGLIIMDMSNITDIQVLGRYGNTPSSYEIKSIAVLNDTAFVGRYPGLDILDISNLSYPTLLTNYQSTDGYGFSDIVISENNAFVVTPKTFQILDISNVTQPIVLGSYIGLEYNPSDNRIILSKDLVFVINGDSGLHMIDISDPMSIRLLGRYSYTYPDGASTMCSVAISGNMAYVTTYSTYSGFEVVDLTKVVLTGIPFSSDFSIGQQFSITAIAEDNNRTLVEDIFVLTLNDFPRLVQTTLTDQSIFPDQSFVVAINCEQIFSNPSTSFLRLSASTENKSPFPSWLSLKITPSVQSVYDIEHGEGYPMGMAISDDILFLSQMPVNGDIPAFKILDVSDPINPRLLGESFDAAPQSQYIELSENIVFTLSFMGLNILNLSDPTDPKLIAQYGSLSGIDMAIAGNALFIACGSVGLKILDKSNFTNLTLVNVWTDCAEVDRVSILEDIAFVACSDNLHCYSEGTYCSELKILDVSNLTHPEFLISYHDDNDLETHFYNVLFLEKNRLVVLSDRDFRILYMDDLKNLQLLYKHPVEAGTIYACLSGTILFVKDFIQGLEIFDIKNFTNPTLLGKYMLRQAGPNEIPSIEVSRNNLFVSNPSAGLEILDLRTWKLTANPTTADEGNYHLKLVATDIIGSSVSKAFTIRVEGPPRIHNPIPPQSLKTGQPFYLAAAGTFTDPNFDPLVFTLSSVNSTTLPAWLNFDPVTVTFSGTPTVPDLGILTLQLTATDPLGGTASNQFNITVGRPPAVINTLSPLTLIQGVPFTYSIPVNIFNGYGQTLSYDLLNGDGGPLPSEFQFFPTNLTLAGTPEQFGISNLLWVATYGSHNVLSTPLNILIHANLPILPPQYAKVATAFSYYAVVSDGISNPSFNPLTFSAAGFNSALTIQTTLPSWLNFNPGTLTFSGTPSSADVGTIDLCLMAQDSLGNIARTVFNVTVIYPPELGESLQPLTLIQNVPFSYILPVNTTFNPHGQSLKYSMASGEGDLLPAGFLFNSSNVTLWGGPQTTGILNLLLMARDAVGDTLSTTLSILTHASLPTISTQYAKVAQAFSYYALVSDGISNPSFNPLTFSAAGFNSALTIQTTLPSWLNFNPGTLTFSGTPSSADVGTIDLCLMAQDSLGNIARTVFNVTVIYPPELGESLQPLTLIQNVPFSYTLPVNTTFNPHGQSLKYSMASGEGNLLPVEFQFNSGNVTLGGSPQTPGVLNLLLIARDEVGDTLSAPLSILTHASLPTIPTQYAKVSQPFSYYAALSDGLDSLRFSPLVFSARRAQQTTLPSWLNFNPGTFTFGGTPSTSDLGTTCVRLSATDSLGGMAYTDFNITVIYAPKVNQPITQAVNLLEGRYFTFSIPQGTFYSYGETLTYSIKSGDGSGLVPSWIQFNPNNATLFGTPQNAGAVTLFLIAQDAAHNQASTSLSLIISANAPPQMMQPISTQTAQAGQLFNFFVPANTFADPNGDPLTYSAKLLGGAAFPNWLQFDPNTVSFKGTPGRQDTNAFSARTLTVVLIANDTKQGTETLFNINVGGTSNYALFLKIFAPTLSVLGALFGLYRNRAHISNRVRYPKHQKPEQEIRVGEPFILSLSTPPHLVGSIKAKTIHVLAPKGCARYTDCQRFFKKPLHYLKLPYDQIPGGESLPRWMGYDENSNILHSKGPVPDTHYRILNIRVKDKNGYVTEQFDLKIVGATLSSSPAEEEARVFSTLPTRARLEKEQNQSEIELSNTTFVQP